MGRSRLRLFALWVALAALAIGLRRWSASLTQRDTDSRAGGSEVAALVDRPSSRLFDERGEVMVPVAAVTVERTDGRGGRESFFYARVSGLWRCTTHLALVADQDAVLGLVQSVIDAKGVVRVADLAADDPTLAEYGLDAGACVRVSLHGVDVLKDEERDVLFAVDLGRSLARGGVFARRIGGDEVLELDRDLAAGLRFTSRPVVGLPTPPLIDRHVIPNAWPGFRSGIARVFVDRADGSGFELRREAAPGPPGPDGRPTGTWTVVDAETGESAAAHPVLATGFELFLAHATFAAPIDPRSVQPSALERPDATLTIQPVEGEALEVLFLRPKANGARVVVDRFSQTAVEVERAIAELLLPDVRQLTDPSMGIPWDPYLR
ncbi:DUF4340 domain-containing protein [Engelhardtia mirabilis]|uniref:Uncharacterized protein n=1 Tax=Engelhardtia mirabilis TaxID=2528011 RepID=A0A518BI43_9BACT|nr:hypothetical protein Pla133_17120 [Planctomycetes bacterium Pla133]QDV00962.1 hypothetical protein Pla86_17110 [Planctomycetes bacterium Pla86]